MGTRQQELMHIDFIHNTKKYQANLAEPLDISIPLKNSDNQVKCFYAPDFECAPVRTDNFVGSTHEGSPVNFFNVRLNPHGNGTHTECVGHISTGGETINQSLKEFHFVAQLITIEPTPYDNGDDVIDEIDLTKVKKETIKALIIRTTPNEKSKLTRDYSGTNPPYFSVECVEEIVRSGVHHLIVDLPSIDREEDDGKLSGHKKFWDFPHSDAANRTISELVYIDDAIKDGLYLVNIQIPSFELDAAPSKIVLYRMTEQ